MNLTVGSLAVGVIIILLTSQGFPYQPILIGLGVISIMIDTNLKKFFIVLCAIGYLIIAYDDTFVKAGYAPPLMFPGPGYVPSLTEFLARQGLSILAGVACVLLNGGQHKEHTRSLESAEAAVEMAQGLADKLLAYDTEGARLLLKEYKARGKVDRRLIKKYKQMTKNLDKYQ